jgi:hypothetical protein
MDKIRLIATGSYNGTVSQPVLMTQTPWLYGSYEASCLYLVFIFSWGTWNGASYYIEVFSEQYKLQFLKVILDPFLLYSTLFYVVLHAT